MDRRDFLQRSAAAMALVACGPVARELTLAPAQVYTGDASPLAFAADGARAMLDPMGNTVLRLSSSGAAQFRRSALGSALGEFNNPIAAAFDSAGNMLVVDRGNHRVQVLDKTGKVAGAFGADQFAAPSAIAIDAQDRVYVADTFNHRISVWQNGTHVRHFGDTLNAPRGIALWPDGEVWVLDAGNRRIQRFDTEGVSLGTIALSARIPRDIAISRDNLVYVADLASSSMQVLDRQGNAQAPHSVAIDGRPAIALYLVTDASGEVHAAAIAS